MRRRVVITGYGAVTSHGDAPASVAAMFAGTPGAAPIRRFDASGLPVRFACEAVGFDADTALGARRARRMDRFQQFGLAAALEAWTMAGLAACEGDDRRGVYLGVGIGGVGEIADGTLGLAGRDGWKSVSPFFVPRVLPNLAVGQVAVAWGAQGSSLATTTACAAANDALLLAAAAIAEGEIDAALAGGCEAAITPLSVSGFAVMRALSRRNEEPTRASRPFDADRDGFVMGEGAGVLVLEALEHAQARGATILAEFLGGASTNDAHHDTHPPPGGAGAARCMRRALARAGLAPQEVDHVNAHGTSTPLNDVAEAQAIRAVFGDHAERLPVASTKGVTGHLLGAAGGIEAIASIESLRRGVVPPTANLDRPDPACDIFLPARAIDADLRVVASNAFGFGGSNTTVLFRRWGD